MFSGRPSRSWTVAKGLFLLLVAGTLASCGLYSQGVGWHTLTEPQRTIIADVPFYPQEDFLCGPASLAMVLTWSGQLVTPTELISEVYTPAKKGSLQSAIISAARRHGRIAYPIKGAEHLMAEIAKGHPVVVLLNLGLSWYPKWHYAVVVGYDLPTSEIVLHSGNIQHDRLSFRVFENIWTRSKQWGVLVLPPTSLPAVVTEKDWLEAVTGLERAAQWSAALKAYETALSNWPDSYAIWMGLGNSYYSLNNLSKAILAFQKAAEIQPKNGIAFNNLAHILAETGKRKEALAAAQKAVACGGPLLETFKKTLSEIK
ncbi:MAG: PA2778 family cysteine peptidase [Thermodesulfobacteriota bacterium]